MDGIGRIVPALALLLALPANAQAGTAELTLDTDLPAGQFSLAYNAAPGEANRLVIDLERSAGRREAIVVRDLAGLEAGAGCEPTIEPAVVRCPLNRSVGHFQISVRTSDANDEIVVASRLLRVEWAFDVRLDAGAGDDKVTGGGTIIGGPGDDALTSGPLGAVLVAGGADSGSDTIVGGGGFDVVSYRQSAEAVSVDLDGNRDDGAPGENDQVGADVDGVVGGSGNDVIAGNGGANTLSGMGGSDVVEGRSGDDLIFGHGLVDSAGAGPVNDRLDGGRGDDLIVGSAGVTSLRGGSGRDRISARRGRDRVRIRDGLIDEVDCSRVARVLADSTDFTGGSCRHVRRNGRPRPVPVAVWDLGTFFGTHRLRVTVGCPSDGPPVCRGSVHVVVRGRRLRGKPFRARHGHTSEVDFATRTQIRHRELTIVVRYRNGRGRLRRVILRAPAQSRPL